MGEYSISKNISVEDELAEASRRWNSYAEIEEQKRRWDEGFRDPILMKKAESIIDNLNGRRFTLDTLTEKHFYVFSDYLILAAKKAGYRLRPDLMRFPWFVYDKIAETHQLG